MPPAPASLRSPPEPEPSLGELVRLTLDDAKQLAQAELQLAKAELRQASRRLAWGVGAACAAPVVLAIYRNFRRGRPVPRVALPPGPA